MMLGVPESNATHGLLSLTTVRLFPGHPPRVLIQFPVNAIIFLAPISTFDQVLAEVRRVHPEENSHAKSLRRIPT